MSIYNLNEINPSTYISLIKSKVIRPVYRVTLLNFDESFKMDISDYVIASGSTINVEYKQGQRRSMTLELDNTSGIFTPNGIEGLIWINSKFKVEFGIEDANGDIIYNSVGIFVIGNPNLAREGAQNTMSLQCYDKFALLDGTLGGNLGVTYQINAGSNVYNAMQTMLLFDNGNGYALDNKSIIFDSLYANITTAVEISKTPSDTYGSLLIELANMIACDIWYDVNGNLTVRAGIVDISHVNNPTLWKYSDSEMEYLSTNIEFDFAKCKNDIIVVGANSNNNAIYTGEAKNYNPNSPTAINIIGTKLSYIEDSNIYSDSLAQQRAEYELNKASIINLTISITSSYMIHLDVNECIELTDNKLNYNESRFIIQSLSMPMSIDSKITISCTNLATLPYYSEV
jgi:hypothetical protein